jgi:hypothetical protein
LRALPDPEPLAQLSAATGAVYAQLVTLTDNNGATTAELALAVGLGRSTTGKALVSLEEWPAVRTPGGHDGPRRIPDRWRAAPAPWTNSSDASSAQEATPTDSASSTADTSESHASHRDDESTPASASTTDSEESSTDDESSATIASVADAPHDTSHQDGKHPDEDVENEADAHHASSNDGPEPDNTTAEQSRQAKPEKPTTAGQHQSPSWAKGSGSRPERSASWSSTTCGRIRRGIHRHEDQPRDREVFGSHRPCPGQAGQGGRRRPDERPTTHLPQGNSERQA